MLSTTPNGGPATFVTINGMVPTNPHCTQFPGTMFAIPSGLTTSNLLPGQNLATGPFMLPSSPFPQGPPNLTCAVPYSSSQFQPTPPPPPPPPPTLFPFLTHTAGGLLTTSPHGPLSLPSQFAGPLPPHLLQPQPPPGASNLPSFSPSLSTNSALNTLNIPNTLPPDHNHANGNNANHTGGGAQNGNTSNGMSMSSVSPALFANHLASSPLILPTLSFAMGNQSLSSNPSDVLSFSLAPPCSTSVAVSNSMQIPITPTLCTGAPAASSISSSNTIASVPNCSTSILANSVGNTNISTSASPISNNATSIGNFTIASCSTPSILSTTVLTATSSCSSSASPSSCSVISTSERSMIAPSTGNGAKSDKTQPPILSASPSSANSRRLTASDSLHALESVDFHRDVILDAIDKLRERKARPDFERISCLLKRHQNINPDHTQVCLGRLAASGAVVCVDYKGNLSYRNPSKWRKTAANSATVNPTGVSQRLVDAVRRLMLGTVQGQLNASNCIDPSIVPLLNAQPGPNGGYSLFQIERALQATKSSVENVPGVKPFPELTGATLRVCLDREAIHGKLAKTADGRYVLDESGERKKLSAISNNTVLPPHLSNKKPIPPSNGCGLYSSSAPTHSKYGKYASAMQPIAPAGDYSSTLNRPLAVKQLPANGTNPLSSTAIRPLGLSPLQPLLSRPTGPGRRGRPPGPKSRRHAIQSDAQAPAEKKIKTESWSTTGDSPLSTTSLSSPITGTNCTATTTTTTVPTSLGLGGQLIPVTLNGMCTSTALPLPSAFIPSLASGTFSSTTILPTFTSIPPSEFPLSMPLSSAPLMTFATGLTASSSSSSATLPVSVIGEGIPSTAVVSVNSSTTSVIATVEDGTKPCADRWLDSPGTTVPSESVHSDADSMMNEKTDGTDDTMLCSRCCGLPTKEEPFLICKDCNLGAHPTCLDYWPELTERARQSPWQCSDCKTCTVCQGKGYENELLICDACDKGFHSECHEPKLQEPVDRSLPWVCAACQKEGYSVAIGTLPGVQDDTGSTLPGSMDTDTTEHGTKSPKEGTDAKQLGDSALNASASAVHEQSKSVDASSEHSKTPTPTPAASPAKPCTEAVQPVIAEGSSNPPSTTSPVKPSGDVPPTDSSDHVPSVRSSHKTNPGHETESKTEPDQLPSSCSTNLITSQHTVKSSDHGSPIASGNQSKLSMTQREEQANDPMPEKPDSPASTDPLPSRNEDLESRMDDGPSQPLSADALGTFASRPDDIRAWSVEHVRDWLLGEGFPREAEAFFQQEIDGACLLLMKRMDVLTELGIKLGPAVKIYERIKRLQSRCTSPNILCP